MKSKRTCSHLLPVLAASLLPLCAQTPLFTDGPAFGGSKVFSEGRNPMGNSARLDQAVPGWYFSYVDGDQRAKDNKAILGDAAALDPALASAALARLGEAPWAQRTRAFGIAGCQDSAQFAVTREEFNGVLAQVDLDPAHLGSTGALGANLTTLTGRRSTVDRITFGGGGMQSGTAFGGTLRLERWTMGRRAAARNPGAGQFALATAENELLGFTQTQDKTLTYAMDLGFVAELAQGLRFGATVDQLNGKRLWDVNMKPQFKAGLQFDLGATTKLSVEADINGAERMPFPVKQQAASASLRFSTSPAVAFLVGVERRKIGDATVSRGGVTLQFRTASILLGLGFQVGQDSPLKGASIMVH